MSKRDIDLCHPPKKSEGVLFHKCIFKTEEDARNILLEKKLAPGQIAVARYYVNYREEYINEPTFDGIRMIMAIGGATPGTGMDTYFFKDSVEANDDSYVTIAQLKESLNEYYTKEEVDELIANIPTIDDKKFATKEELDNKVDKDSVYSKKEVDDKFTQLNIDNYATNKDVEDLSTNINNEIKTIKSKFDEYATKDALDNKVDKDSVYTKKEVDDKILDVSIYVEDRFAKKEELEKLNSEVSKKVDASFVENYFNTNVEEINNILDNKADASTVYTKSEVDEIINKIPIIDETEFVKNDIFDASIKNIYDELNNRVDASFVENYFNTNVETEVNRIITETNIPGIVEDEIKKQDIAKQVSDAVDEKLKEIDGVTTENLSEVLQNDTYFTQQVINPIQTLETEVQTLKESVVTSIDGGKEEVWYYSPVTSLEEMIYAIESGDAVELESDIELNNVALVLENVYTTINLNDKKIIGGVFTESNGDMLEGNSDSYAIWVKNGSEVDIKGDGEVVAQDASYSMAVWADGGVVNIYGGTYKNGGDGCDLIYAKNGGVVNIYGGTFIATKNTGKEPATTNEYSALNIHNTNPGKINVYGGSFYKFNPENNDDTNRFGSFVVEGYKVVLEGDYYNVVKE